MRIAGINVPENKRLEIALTAVVGIGRPRAKKILEALSIELCKQIGKDPSLRVS